MAGSPDVPKRFFVEVRAQSPEAVRRLHAFGVDLFRTTAAEHPEDGFGIEGLLSLDEVGRLVEAGYPVLVSEESSRRAASLGDVSDFAEWLAGRRA